MKSLYFKLKKNPLDIEAKVSKGKNKLSSDFLKQHLEMINGIMQLVHQEKKI